MIWAWSDFTSNDYEGEKTVEWEGTKKRKLIQDEIHIWESVKKIVRERERKWAWEDKVKAVKCKKSKVNKEHSVQWRTNKRL